MRVINRVIYFLLMGILSSKKKYKVCRYFHGIQFGTNVSIIGFPRWASEPYLIRIGSDVTIAHNVVFHTHDGGVRTFRKTVPGINVFGRITVGDNVFIGSDSIILPNVKIGNNVVIGSGSVVSRDIPDNVVAVGCPAKPIKTLEQYQKDCVRKGIIVPPNLSRKGKMKFIKTNI